jgi:F-type H+-transporting ATPase subunit a
MIARLQRLTVFVLVLLLGASLTTAPAHAAADSDGELTLKTIVDEAIIGHAADGYYLDFKPFGVMELPRIFLARTADGTLTLDAYGSTKSALKSEAYAMKPHGDGEGHSEPLIQTPSAEAFAAKEHLHSDVKRASGSIVVDFSISRHLVFGLLSMVLVFGVFLSLAQRYSRGVGRTEAPKGTFQNMMEVLVVFIRDEVAKPNIGEKYQKFLPYLLTAFFFILVSNILGLVPFAGAATSNIAVTAVLAFMTFAIGLIYGSKHHYEHLLLGPPDAPVGIRIILVPIEILGLITRHVALAIRLFANMMGGSLIIFSLIGLIFIMNVLFGETAAIGTSIISTGFTVFILLLKLLVAFIQAYVFTILSALFIGMSVEEGHHEEGHVPEVEDHDKGELTPTLGGGDGVPEERTKVDTGVAATP